MNNNNGQSVEIASYQQTIQGFIPDRWKNINTVVTAYKVINSDKKFVNTSDHIKDFENIRVVWMYGKLNYRKFDDQWDYLEEKKSFRLFVKFEDIIKEGTWIIFIQPDVDSEFDTTNALSAYCGVFIAMNGLGNVFEQEFQHRYSAEGNMSSIGKRLLHPGTLPNVNTSSSYLDIINSIINSIDSFDKVKAKRILLSLHWFEKSHRTAGIESFINIWIAFEALTMKTTDIKELKVKVGNIYNVTSSVAGTDFFINRLSGLRGDIVHNGFVLPMHSVLSDYLSALFTDLLMHECNIPTLKFAGKILESRREALVEIFSKKK